MNNDHPRHHVDLASQALGFDITHVLALLNQTSNSHSTPLIPRPVLLAFLQNAGCTIQDEDDVLKIYEVAIRHFVHSIIKDAKKDAYSDSSLEQQQVTTITRGNVENALRNHGKNDTSVKFFTQDDGGVERL